MTDTESVTITVSSYIDGEDYLYIQGNTLWWQAVSFTPVGDPRSDVPWTTTNVSTTLDGAPDQSFQWQPVYQTNSSLTYTYAGLDPALSAVDTAVSLTVIQGRDSLTILQQPNASDGQTLILDFNDDASGGASLYTAQLTFTLGEPPSLSVSILGTAQEGQTLTAVVSVGTASSYQWQSSSDNGSTWQNISGATGQTYLVQESDEGNELRLEVTGSTGTATSAATGAVTDITLAFTTPASISGTAQVGQILTAVNGTLDDSDAAVTGYQWTRDGQNISGATGSTYTVGAADEGQDIAVVETATDGGASATSTSAAVAVGPATILQNTNPGGTIFGLSSSFGEVFTAPITGYLTSFTLYLWGVTNVLGVVEPWQGSGTPLFVSGFTAWNGVVGAQPYTFAPEVQVTAGQQYVAFLTTVGDPYTQQIATFTQTNIGTAAPGLDFIASNNSTSDAFSNANWSSGQGNTLFSADFSSTPLSVSILGAAQEGQKLTAVVSGGTATGYQWLEFDGNWTAISGATHSTYTVTQADADKGFQIEVQVTSDDGSVTSAATPNVPASPFSVSISGTAQEGQTLSAVTTGSVARYQWQADIGGTWTNIAGATSSTYAVTEAVEGDKLRVETFPTGGGGTKAVSSATNAVTAAPSVLTIADDALTVPEDGSVGLGVSVSVPDADDVVTLKIVGLRVDESITDSFDNQPFVGGTGPIILTASEVNSGLTLNSAHTGKSEPVNSLTLTPSLTDSAGKVVRGAAQTITVTDPPDTALLTQAMASLGASGSGSTNIVMPPTQAGPELNLAPAGH